MTRNRFNEVKTILLDSNLTENGPIVLSDNLHLSLVLNTLDINSINGYLRRMILLKLKLTISMTLEKKNSNMNGSQR